MSVQKKKTLSRRGVLAGGAALLASPAIAQEAAPDVIEGHSPIAGNVRRNASSFRALDWQPYFNNTRGGAILVDVTSRALHYWSEDQTIYKLYPTSVPISEAPQPHGAAPPTPRAGQPSAASAPKRP